MNAETWYLLEIEVEGRTIRTREESLERAQNLAKFLLRRMEATEIIILKETTTVTVDYEETWTLGDLEMEE